MRYKNTPCILPLFVALLALCCCGVPRGMAADELQHPCAAAEAAGQEPGDSSVSYRTAGDFSLGYQWATGEDSLQAAEYIYPHSSLTFGLNLLSCPLPFRYHVNTDFLSRDDFYTDAGFAYRDLILFRDILVGAHHNLHHVPYQYPGEPPALTYGDRNPGDQYYTDLTSNLLSLRLKAPEFPFHAFVNNRTIVQDGTVQQRYLLGDFSQLNKISASRNIDWQSNALKLGVNSHAGPVELEYALDQARFKPGANNILYDTYPDSASRPGDIYPHAVVPETEASGHTVKLHSSYTGGLVTAATLGNLTQKNNYSQTESNTWKGAFDCSWIPQPVVGLFFKYRHQKVDMDTPATVSLAGRASTLHYAVREGISSSNDVFSLATRYRPARSLALFTTYELSHLERENVAAWPLLSGAANTHTLTLAADARPLDQIKVKASYEYKNYKNPSYNNTPDNSNKLRLTATYMPAPWLNVYLEYILAVAERDALRYLNPDPYELFATGERDGRRDQALASVATELSATMTLTASWLYQRFDVEQDLAYKQVLPDDTDGPPYLDGGVPYTDTSNSFSLALFYTPWPDITVGADVTHTIFEGKTGYDDVVGGTSVTFASFSALKGAETIFSFDIAKKLPRGWEIGLASYLGLINDRAYDFLDGREFTTLCKMKRYY